MKTANYVVKTALGVSAIAALLGGCRSGPTRDPGDTTLASSDPGATPDVMFADVADASGLDFVHFNGMSGRFYDAEIFGPGVGLLDYDNDGDLDVYLVQGTMLGDLPLTQATFAPRGPLNGRLFRNDLQVGDDGTRTLRFTDVTAASGITTRAYGMGVAAGDIDNDGWVDLYLTNLGPNQMLRNNGDGTFSDVSAASGTADPAWSVSASFVDIDRDGWLDLFVGNYLAYSITTDKACTSVTGEPDYCAPTTYRAERSRLYRNRGDGTFTDVTAAALIGGEYGPALGTATADFNRDGWVDIFVANDGQPDQLWINQRNGTFVNTALLAGAAFNADGRPTASMGVDAADFDNDGDEDLFHTNLTGEMNTLLSNDGTGQFVDVTVRVGLGVPSLPDTGFGTGWLDVDNDGWLDLLAVNGAVRVIEVLARNGDPFPIHQPNRLYRNVRGRFEDVTARAGPAFALSEVSRGAAFGDVDNDGDVDVVVGNNNGPVRLLLNQVGNRSHWVGLRLVGRTPLGDVLGARIGVTRRDSVTLWRRTRSDGSFASANDPRVIVGLGDLDGPVGVEVVWPDGERERWDAVAGDRWTTLRRGTGR